MLVQIKIKSMNNGGFSHKSKNGKRSHRIRKRIAPSDKRFLSWKNWENYKCKIEINSVGEKFHRGKIDSTKIIARVLYGNRTVERSGCCG